jgi:16S rRNA (adenine1518-N6/adenine1519-N6)-dimethyltransferase
MTPEEIKKILAPYGLRPSRDRGQNFLLDDRVVRSMVDCAGIKPGDCVLEIGPGLGMLTEILLARGAQVLAIELDHVLARILQERLPNKTLEVLEADFLSCSNQDLVRRLKPEDGVYKVVANLPYSITSAALSKLLAEPPHPKSITILVQREVAWRATAQPPKTSLLSVVVDTYGKAKVEMSVLSGSFWPKPKVDSAVLHISLYSREENATRLAGMAPENFLSIVSLAFSEKRKQLKNTLVRKFDSIAISHAMEIAKIQPQERPERLTFKQWVTLAKELKP